jgi:SAM-dependent methyltransferase
MFARVLSPVRALRRQLARWSVSEDRLFHDSLFGQQHHDPFSPSYQGYLTIRRFADLASEHLEGVGAVLDLGCGPGEITCELARRYPDVQFTAIDHSAAAIERGRANALRLGVRNVTFATGDLTSYRPPSPVDLVVMFDAFHHLLEPERFVKHAAAFTGSFFLIEPAGDRAGRWRRTLDFDWLPCEMDKIRARIEYAMGAQSDRAVSLPAAIAALDQGRAVENRYPQEDYRRFFDGLSLTFRGTVAGLDVYAPEPHYRSPWRERTMQAAYDLLAQVDDELQRRAIDHYAKHWAIHATRSASTVQPPAQDRPRPSDAALPVVQGAFDASYRDAAIPGLLPAGAEVLVELTVHNLSWREWRSEDSTHPVMLSYHWADGGGRSLVYDGVRTPLRRPIPPGGECRTTLRVLTPPSAGSHVLEIDLVEERVSWFSAAGVPPLRVPVRISK